MKRLRRLALSPAALAFLQKRTAAVVAAPKRRAKARKLWKLQANATFREMRRLLTEMAPGVSHCMYCENSEATDIDHFRPKARYPRLAFRWENHLLACSACNSNYKRDEFPRDKNGRRLLIDPTRDDPREHLALSPHTGVYVALTPRGAESIRVFGLERATLTRCRQAAWGTVEALILRYAIARRRNDDARALDSQRDLCRFPHASVFEALLDVSRSPAASRYIDPDCLAALAAHPEIRGWAET